MAKYFDSAIGDRDSAGAASSFPNHKFNANTTAASGGNIQLVGADLIGGLVVTYLSMQAIIGAATNIVLPSVSDTVAALRAAGITPEIGMTWECSFYNSQSGAYVMTIVGDAGSTWTMQSPPASSPNTGFTLAKGSTKRCMCQLTSLTTGIFQGVG